jgi:hypothetical protein
LVKPGAGVGPPAFGGGGGDAEDGGGFFDGEAGEVAEFDEFGFWFVEGGEFFEGVVNGEEFVVRSGRGDFELVDVEALLVSAMAQGTFAAGAFDEDAAHGFGGSPEKVGAVLPGLLVGGDEAKPGFVNEGSGLERVAGGFVGHAMDGEFAQFFVNEREQFVRSFAVATFDSLEDVGDVAHFDSAPVLLGSISALASFIRI